MLSPFLVRTAIFDVRNVDKTQEGHVGRAAVVLGQTKNIFDSIKELDCGIAKSAQSASSVFHKACENDVVVNKVGKVLKVCGENVNPLIWASAGIDIAFADNKKEALVENVAGLGTMRLTEEFMKKHLDSVVGNTISLVEENEKIGGFINKVFKNTDDKLMKSIGKNAPPILKGVLFVIGSCLAFDAGKKIGDKLLGKTQES